jgi:tripartite-type tricarboxylate transporter receptor subunit TctC
VLARLREETAKVLKQPEVIAQMHQLGAEPGNLFGPDFSKFMDAEIARWGEIIRKSGAQAE